MKDQSALDVPSSNRHRNPASQPPDTGDKKFNSRPAVPTFFRNEPFGEHVEGLCHCGSKGCGSKFVFKSFSTMS
jgi:hypothetical protein